MTEFSSKRPILNVSQSHIDFGVFIDPDTANKADNENDREINLQISNIGGGQLTGFLLPQVNWLSVDPGNFILPPGESSTHRVTVLAGAPQPWNWQEYFLNDLIIINSNGGITSISGSYITRKTKDAAQHPEIDWKKIFLYAFIPFFLIAAALGSYFLFSFVNNQSFDQTSLYLTMGAGTVYAQMRDTDQFQTTLTGISEYAAAQPLTGQLEDAFASTAQPTTTHTPWPREDFPNPEQFILQYYQYLNAGLYEQAWGMLSTHFQEGCCNVAGNNPYTVYENYWKNVQRVDVVSAYLQAWDKNPAEVLATLHYTLQNGAESEGTFTYKLLADAGTKTLLIDEVY